MRKLASIQKVIKVEPIPDADAIEMIQVLGWELVSKKGEFLPGQLCVYCEIDSFLPIAPEFEFLRKSCYRKMADGTEGFRIKTVRLRSQLSQGIAFPMSILPEGNYQEGDDVTDILNIVKYEPPIPACLDGIKKGDFPSFIPKSDETRCIAKNTIIKTDKGEKLIQEVIKNPLKYKILSKNTETGIEEFVSIIDTECRRNNNNWFEIKTENGNILYVTEDHFVFLPELNCYRQVKDLIVGDILEIK